MAEQSPLPSKQQKNEQHKKREEKTVSLSELARETGAKHPLLRHRLCPCAARTIRSPWIPALWI